MKFAARLAALVFALASPLASADQYVCFAEQKLQPSSSYGAHGFVLLKIYDGPSCSGNFVGHRFFCSKGGLSSSCQKFTELDQAGLIAIFEGAQQAMNFVSRVGGAATQCNDSTFNCWSSLLVYAPL